VPGTQPLLLSTSPPTRRHTQFALGIALALAVGYFAAAPWTDVQLPVNDQFIPIVDSILFLTDALTAVLLLAQFSVTRSRALLALVCGYAFTALMIVPHALTFPGAFSATGLLGAGLQTTVWVFVFWHLGLPVSVLTYVLLRRLDGATPLPSETARRTAAATIGATALAAAGLAALTISAAMPVIMIDPQLRNDRWPYVAGSVVLLTAAAIAVLWRSRRSVLDVWLLVVLWAWLIEMLLLSGTPSRFSLAWYSGRIYGLLSAGFVLFALLAQTTVLYARLANSMAAWQRENENRLMTMDAMAASIAHEIKQPLAAIVANGGAGQLRLQRAVPDLAETNEILRTIVADAMRASEVLAGIRALVRRGDRETAEVDIADVLGHALVFLHGDLQAHGISVDADLSRRLPTVRANKAQLQQVFVNLILNAMEAMDTVRDRPRALTIRNDCVDDEIRVDVQDSGPGIDADTAPQIFEAFYTTKARGTGMGLAICKSIVESHGGRLWATANDRHGATFHVALPRGAAATAGSAG
jgi:signal transduction histidine kinase